MSGFKQYSGSLYNGGLGYKIFFRFGVLHLYQTIHQDSWYQPRRQFEYHNQVQFAFGLIFFFCLSVNKLITLTSSNCKVIDLNVL